MIQSEAYLRLRVLLNETTAGFWTEPQLYQLLDSAQMLVAEMLLHRQTAMRKTEDRLYRIQALEPLLNDTTGNVTIGSDYIEYSLPTGFWELDYAEYSSTNGTLYLCVRVSGLYEGIRRYYNSFASATDTTPLVYIRGSKVGFFPQPSASGTNKYRIVWYKRPTLISAGNSGQEISLLETTHDSIILAAQSLALLKDDRTQDAQSIFEIVKNHVNLTT